MNLSSFVGKPCKSRLAFEFIPKKKTNLKLKDVAEKLRQAEVFVEIETPFLLILRTCGKEASLFRSGKIIVKETNIESEAKKIAKRIAEKI